jgi:hypothetical protein
MNKNDLVSLCEEGRKMVNFPERSLSESERGFAQFVTIGYYSKRFSFEEESDKKESYLLVLDKWINNGYAKDFSDVWESVRNFKGIFIGMGFVFAKFSGE